ncbi:MAG: cyclic pyranopterin monophosphate synthase MoaC [Pseudomonadota bacterium]|nr:cyclic pyranopterin monophosphate synthase MoaC [Pseudomonadota bacterium]
MTKLTHLDDHGSARMVDTTEKAISVRVAKASGWVSMRPDTLQLIAAGGHKKGDVLTVARIAGIQAAKRCADLIPLCHGLPLSGVDIDFDLDFGQNRVGIVACCRVRAQTGVEMEALTAVSVAALTIYDMCKAADKGIAINGVRLLEKTGGRSGTWRAPTGADGELESGIR